MKQLITLFACGFALSLFITACSPKQNLSTSQDNKVNKDIYLQQYSLRDDVAKDLNGTVKQVAEMGFTGIEAAGYDNGKLYGMEPNAFADFLKINNLTLLSSHTGKQLADDISKTNWDEIWKWWDLAIATHKAAGAKYIVTPWMPTPKTLSDLKKYCDYYNQIGERCNNAGLKFGYHNHDFELKKIEGQVMYDYMLKNTDPSKVFFQMDCYWIMRGGKSPVDYFKTYPGRFQMLHIKDEKELGESGMMGFDAIFKNIDYAGTKYIILEQERYTYAPIVSVQRSLNYLLNSPFVKARYD